MSMTGRPRIGHPRINWSDPFTKGLDLCLPFTEQIGDDFVDLMHNTRVWDIGSTITPSYRVTKWGPSLDFDGINDKLNWDATTYTGAPGDYTLQFTIIALVRFDGFITDRNVILSRRDGTGFQYVFRTVSSTARLSLLCTGGAVDATTNSLVAGIDHVIGVSRGSATTTFFTDGKQIGTAVTNTSITRRPINTELGGSSTGSDIMDGTIAGIFAWRRAFTPMEHAAFAAMPFRIFEAPTPIWFFKNQITASIIPQIMNQRRMRNM